MRADQVPQPGDRASSAVLVPVAMVVAGLVLVLVIGLVLACPSPRRVAVVMVMPVVMVGPVFVPVVRH
jgi:hypothetical protein